MTEQQVIGLGEQIEELAGEALALAKWLKTEEAISGGEALEILAKLGPQTVPQIARRRGTSRQNIQLLVNRLAREGWVETRTNPGHKRSDLVHLTEKGRDELERLMTRKKELWQAMCADVNEEEVLKATTLLRRMRSLVHTPKSETRSPSRSMKATGGERSNADKSRAAAQRPATDTSGKNRVRISRPGAIKQGAQETGQGDEFPVSLL